MSDCGGSCPSLQAPRGKNQIPQLMRFPSGISMSISPFLRRHKMQRSRFFSSRFVSAGQMTFRSFSTCSRMHNMNIDGFVMGRLMNWRSTTAGDAHFAFLLSMPPKEGRMGENAWRGKERRHPRKKEVREGKSRVGGGSKVTQKRRRPRRGKKSGILPPRLEAQVI